MNGETAGRQDDLPAKPFAIGLAPLGDQPWLIVDDRLPDYLAEKTRLRKAGAGKVFSAEPHTSPAQAETLERVLGWQTAHHPESFSRKGDAVHIKGVGDPIHLGDHAPALQIAADLCAEDLVLMRKDGNEWRLVAASLSFPSSWSLAEKFTRPIDDIHKPVPGFASGTRNAGLVNRIFDNLAPDEPVLRGNWSIYGDDELHHPGPHSGESTSQRPTAINPDTTFLREERQTLTRLPGTGDLLFTILISLTSFRQLADEQSGRRKATGVLSQLEAMTPEQLAYKALSSQKPALSVLLQQIADGTF